MKSRLTKTLVAGAVMSVLGLASTSASAVIFPDFTFDPTGSGLTTAPGFAADKLTGNYDEFISFTSPTTFSVALKWNAGQFVANDGTSPLSNKLVSRLSFDYELYGLFQASGTVSSSGGKTTFSLNPALSSSLSFFIDRNGDTVINDPISGLGTNPFTTSSNVDDLLLGYGVAVGGSGTLDPASCIGGNGINCGSFGQTTTLSLTADGLKYFTAPVPFYNLSFESGQLNNFDLFGDQHINGSLDVVFGRVPEPATLALMGLGLLGLGASRRSRKES